MKTVLRDLRRRARHLGLCDVYSAKWDACTTRQELFDVATDVNGMGFIADVCSFGWGGTFDTDYLAETYSEFINGRYTRSSGGYTTQLWCNHDGGITVSSALTCVLNCKGVIIVPMGFVCSLVIADRSDVQIINFGRIMELVVYGGARESHQSKYIDTIKNIDISEWRKQ
ncbi:MAG: hypothetical protein HUK08_00175 [Bacteroidaceae bacterium]|nr:hypothetical protein [Bacteroidaceae bacterium]